RLQLDGAFRDEDPLLLAQLHPGLLQGGGDGVEAVRFGSDLEAVRAVVDHVLGAGVDRLLHHLVLGGAGLHRDAALAVEHPGHRVLRGHVAAAPGEGGAHVRHRPRAVVRQALHDHRHPRRAVALVADLLVVGALQLAGALLDRALDVLVGHVRFLGRVHRYAEARVAGGVPAAQPGRHGQLLDDLVEELALGGAHRLLLALDLRPAVVAGHGFSARGGCGPRGRTGRLDPPPGSAAAPPWPAPAGSSRTGWWPAAAAPGRSPGPPPA